MSNILLYIDSMQKGGAQRVMSVIAENLIKAGVGVTLVNDIIPVEGVPEYDLPSEVNRVFLDDNNIRFIKRKNLHRIVKLRKILRSKDYECVLSFLGPPNIRMLVASIGIPIRKVVSVRNDPSVEYGVGLKRFFLKQLFRFATLTVFQTEDASKCFPLSVRRRSTIIPNPVNEGFYKVEWTGEGLDIIAVGRLQPQKNYELLIKAFSLIAGTFPDTDLVICGEGPLRDYLEEMCVTLGIENRVHFLGLVADVNSQLIKSKVFVLSSDYEGMPNSMMEAMAAGVPVISTDCPCGGPRELTCSGEYGILVPCNDAVALSEAMKKMLISKEELVKYHKLSKERAADFNTEKILKRWFEALKI